MRYPFLVAVLALGACASESGTVPREKVAQEETVSSFRVAVVDVCLQSAMAGTPLSALAGENGAIVASASQSGSWSPKDNDAIFIRASGNTCEVSTRGPLTVAALDAVDLALSDPHGFVSETPSEPKSSNIYKRYSKKVGAQTFRVTLNAAQPQSSAGTLVATVTSTPA